MSLPSAKERSGSAAPAARHHERDGQRLAHRPEVRPRDRHRAPARRRRDAPGRGHAAHRRRGGRRMGANPDGSVSRIDPETGRLEATIDTGLGAFTIAAGEEGVWFLGDDDDRRRQDRPAHEPRGPDDPGRADELARHRRRRRLGVGRGERRGRRLADRARAPADHADDRRRASASASSPSARGPSGPRTTSTASCRASIRAPTRSPPGRPSAPRRPSRPAPDRRGSASPAARRRAHCRCRHAARWSSGAEAPDVLIASDLPLQGPDSAGPRALESAIRFVLEQRRFRAGEFSVGYQSCDVSTPQIAAASSSGSARRTLPRTRTRRSSSP